MQPLLAEIISLVEKYFNGSDEIIVGGCAHNGVEAINEIENNKYDVILLDLVMPIKDGFDVLDYIKENNIFRTPKMIISESFLYTVHNSALSNFYSFHKLFCRNGFVLVLYSILYL